MDPREAIAAVVQRAMDTFLETRKEKVALAVLTDAFVSDELPAGFWEQARDDFIAELKALELEEDGVEPGMLERIQRQGLIEAIGAEHTEKEIEKPDLKPAKSGEIVPTAPETAP